MSHGAWERKGHVDAKRRLRHRAAFNGSVGRVGLREGLFGLMFDPVCLGLSFMCISGLVVCSSRS